MPTLQHKAVFERYRDIAGEFYWRFRASSGEPIATCGYTNSSDCLQAIDNLKRAGLEADIVDETLYTVRDRNRMRQMTNH